jgi:hypothetical protein
MQELIESTIILFPASNGKEEKATIRIEDNFSISITKA